VWRFARSRMMRFCLRFDPFYDAHENGSQLVCFRAQRTQSFGRNNSGILKLFEPISALLHLLRRPLYLVDEVSVRFRAYRLTVLCAHRSARTQHLPAKYPRLSGLRQPRLQPDDAQRILLRAHLQVSTSICFIPHPSSFIPKFQPPLRPRYAHRAPHPPVAAVPPSPRASRDGAVCR
jgi:hypothetical protein